MSFLRAIESPRSCAPDLDFEHDTTAALIDHLHPGTDGGTVVLPGDALHWHEVLRDAGERRKLYEGMERGARNHLKALMEDAAVGTLADGSTYQRRAIMRKGYTVNQSTYVDMRHRPAPKGERL